MFEGHRILAGDGVQLAISIDNGAAERANRTDTEEFHEVTTAEPEIEAFQVELRAWEPTYNGPSAPMPGLPHTQRNARPLWGLV